MSYAKKWIFFKCSLEQMKHLYIRIRIIKNYISWATEVHNLTQVVLNSRRKHFT